MIAILKEPNQAVSLKKLRAFVEETVAKEAQGGDPLDLTSISGYQSIIQIDDTLKFPTDFFTPVLLALSLNKLDVARYLLEEL